MKKYLIEEHQLKILDSQKKRRQEELIKKKAKENIILEKILSSISLFPEVEAKKINPPSSKKKIRAEEAVLLLSDLHLGLACTKDEVGGLSEYNAEIFKNRLNSVVEKVSRITDIHRTHSKVETLNLFLLGDNVHGSKSAGRWGYLHMEQSIMDQIFLLWFELEKAILRLKTIFPKINIHCVYGNHGRIARVGMEERFANWDYLLYKILEKTLSKIPGFSWSIPRAPFDIATVNGYKFLLIHGDQIKAWQGIPFYGMVRAEAKYRSLLKRRVNLKEIEQEAIESGIDKSDFQTQLRFFFDKLNGFDYMVLGHFHHLAEMETTAGGRIIMNSSFSGGDDYSVNTLITANTPAQKFFGVHPEGKSWSYDIILDRG